MFLFLLFIWVLDRIIFWFFRSHQLIHSGESEFRNFFVRGLLFVLWKNRCRPENFGAFLSIIDILAESLVSLILALLEFLSFWTRKIRRQRRLFFRWIVEDISSRFRWHFQGRGCRQRDMLWTYRSIPELFHLKFLSLESEDGATCIRQSKHLTSQGCLSCDTWDKFDESNWDFKLLCAKHCESGLI